MKKRVAFLVLCFMISACSFGFLSGSDPAERPVRYSEVFPSYKNSVDVLPREVARQELSQAATSPKKLQRIRLVPLVPHGSNIRLPQYRLFDIQPDGPYHLLGLRNGDVLLAVEDFILYEPSSFPRYVAALTGERGTSFLIVRGSTILEIQVAIGE